MNGEAGDVNPAEMNKVQTGDGYWTGRWRRKFDGDEQGTDRRRVLDGEAGDGNWRW